MGMLFASGTGRLPSQYPILLPYKVIGSCRSCQYSRALGTTGLMLKAAPLPRGGPETYKVPFIVSHGSLIPWPFPAVSANITIFSMQNMHAVFYSTAAMASPVEQFTTRETVVSILIIDDLKARAESDHIVGFTRFRRGEVARHVSERFTEVKGTRHAPTTRLSAVHSASTDHTKLPVDPPS